MVRATSAKIAFCFLGFFFSIGGVLNQNLVYNGLEAIEKEHIFQCYDCNSDYDPRCGDPFDPYTIGMINCTDKKTPEQLVDHLHPERQLKPTLCRKLVQKVEGKLRVIRSCGYIKDEFDDKRCIRRTGTANVEVFYCACTSSLCNTGDSIHPNTVIPLAIGAAIVNMLGRLTVN